MRCHGSGKNKCMRQTETDSILRLYWPVYLTTSNREYFETILTSVLDKQLLLSCLYLCFNMSLCVTWQGICYLLCVLEPTTLKDKLVCHWSESISVLYKPSLQTSLWIVFGHHVTSFANLCLYIYTHTLTHTYISI